MTLGLSMLQVVTGTECRKQPGVVVAVGGGHNCVLSLLLDILQVGNCDQTSEFRYANPDSAFPLSFTVAVTLVVKSLSNRSNIL